MITGIDHATIVTAKLDETQKFFEDALGLEVGDRPDFGFPGAWLYGGGRPILHLVVSKDSVPAAGAIDHVSFATDDYAAALARLDKVGVRYSSQDIPGGGTQAFCRDPNGVLIEITWRGGA
jgi:catechol 2,3-dioxygenase-like lactoylglutathione lyase family enzyme